MPIEGTGVGEAPAMGPSMKGIGPGGLTLKKKVAPKASPKKLKENPQWKKSFAKFATKMSARGK